jgi:GT2 family glycosyltransferase
MGFNDLLKRIVLRIVKPRSENILEKKDYSKTHYVGWVSGACMLVRKAAIDDVGLMDERYFMYAEDMDWCRNFQNYNWRVCYLPDWKVEHNAGRGSSSRFGLSNKLMWIHISSLCKYYAKWSVSKK